MKKVIYLIFVAILFACVPAPIKAQGIPHQYNVATPTTPIGRTIVSGDKLWVQSTGQIIEVTTTFGSTATPYSIVVSGYFRYFPSSTTGIVSLTPLTNGTGYVGTTSLRFLSGYINTLTCGTAFSSPSVTASTTLILPGTGNTITKTSGDRNSVTFSHSVVAGDTLTAPMGMFTSMSATNVNMGTATITTTTAATLAATNVTLGTTGVTTLNVTGTSTFQNVIKECTTPAPFDSTGTVTPAKMLRGVIKCSSTTAVAMTTPTATAISALITGAGQGTNFELIIDNSASTVSGTVTLTLDGSITVGTGVLTGGNTLTVANGTIGKFVFYFISTTAAYCYRIF